MQYENNEDELKFLIDAINKINLNHPIGRFVSCMDCGNSYTVLKVYGTEFYCPICRKLQEVYY